MIHLAVIVNPIAGARRQGEALRALWARLREAGLQVRRLVTRGPGDARRLAEQVAGRADALLVVGGDGTVREVAHGLSGSRTPLLIWPAGTENLVARSVGFRPEPEAVLATLRSGRPAAFDLGVANGHGFLVVVGAGFDAEVVQRLVRVRTGHISHLTYTGPLWRSFWEHRWPDLDVAAETPQGPFAWQGRGMVFVGNMPRYALGLRVVRDAVPDDGLLDLCVMGCRGRLPLLAHAVRTLRRRQIEHPAVRYVRFTRLRVTSGGPVPVEIDGEAGGHLPLDVSVRAGALRVLVPPRPGPG